MIRQERTTVEVASNSPSDRGARWKHQIEARLSVLLSRDKNDTSNSIACYHNLKCKNEIYGFKRTSAAAAAAAVTTIWTQKSHNPPDNSRNPLIIFRFIFVGKDHKKQLHRNCHRPFRLLKAPFFAIALRAAANQPYASTAWFAGVPEEQEGAAGAGADVPCGASGECSTTEEADQVQRAGSQQQPGVVSPRAADNWSMHMRQHPQQQRHWSAACSWSTGLSEEGQSPGAEEVHHGVLWHSGGWLAWVVANTQQFAAYHQATVLRLEVTLCSTQTLRIYFATTAGIVYVHLYILYLFC